MAETELVNEAGVSVFRGTQRPPGGGSQPGTLAIDEMLVTETPGAGTYTGTFTVLPGSRVVGVIVVCENWFLSDTCDVEITDSNGSYIATGVFNAGTMLAFAYDPKSATAPQYWISAEGPPAGDYNEALIAGPTNAGQGMLPPGVSYPTGDTITVTVTTTGVGGVQGVYRVILAYFSAVTATDAVKS